MRIIRSHGIQDGAEREFTIVPIGHCSGVNASETDHTATLVGEKMILVPLVQCDRTATRFPIVPEATKILYLPSRELGRQFFQTMDGRVFTVYIVAGFSIRHCIPHTLCRPGNCV